MTALHIVSLISLLVGVGCALGVGIDVARHPQAMTIMSVVWPVCCLFGGPLTLAAYLRWGRASSREAVHAARAGHRRLPARDQPFVVSVGKGALHCGAGCALGDVIAETVAFLFPAVLVVFGWHAIFAEKIFAVWVLDFVLAFAIGIVFQYSAIVPMRGLTPGRGLIEALKADSLSLAAWQVGMYGFMALAQWVWLPRVVGSRVEPDAPEFWFAMQLAMLTGFVTSYPVNAWLLRRGIKEAM